MAILSDFEIIKNELNRPGATEQEIFEAMEFVEEAQKYVRENSECLNSILLNQYNRTTIYSKLNALKAQQLVCLNFMEEKWGLLGQKQWQKHQIQLAISNQKILEQQFNQPLQQNQQAIVIATESAKDCHSHESGNPPYKACIVSR